MWQKIDRLTQEEIMKIFGQIIRAGKITICFADDPDYRYILEEYQESEKKDDGYYIHLENYHCKDHKSLKSFSQKITYEYFLRAIVKPIFYKLSSYYFHQPEYFENLATNYENLNI